MPPRNPDRLTDLGLASLAVIWGVNFVVVKVGLDVLEPLVFNALRFPLACLVLYAAVRWGDGPYLPGRRDLPALVALGLLGNVVYQVFFIFGIHQTLAGNASIILATVPVWTTVLSLALGHERPGVWVWAGVLGTLFGLALVVVGGHGVSLGRESLRGDLLTLGAAASWAAYTVGSRRLVVEYGALRVTAWTVFIGTVGLLLIALPGLLRTDFGQVPLRAWTAVVYAGVMALAVAYVAWYRGVERLGSSRTAVYSNVVPIVALLAAWVWLGEVPGGLQILGAGIVIGSLTLSRVKGGVAGAPEAVRSPNRAASGA